MSGIKKVFCEVHFRAHSDGRIHETGGDGKVHTVKHSEGPKKDVVVAGKDVQRTDKNTDTPTSSCRF